MVGGRYFLLGYFHPCSGVLVDGFGVTTPILATLQGKEQTQELHL